MNVAPGLCIRPVEGCGEVLGAQEAQQALDALSQGVCEGAEKAVGTPAARNGGNGADGTQRGSMHQTFALQQGDIVVSNRRRASSYAQERKDRGLCEHIAKAMLLSGAKSTQASFSLQINNRSADLFRPLLHHISEISCSAYGTYIPGKARLASVTAPRTNLHLLVPVDRGCASVLQLLLF
jgi:hypothetical protein